MVSIVPCGILLTCISSSRPARHRRRNRTRTAPARVAVIVLGSVFAAAVVVSVVLWLR